MIDNDTIEIIVKEVAKRIISEIKYQKKQVLVVFTGSISGYTDALKSLKAMSKKNYSFKVVLSKNAQRILDQESIKKELKVSNIYVDVTSEEIDYLKKDIDKIVIPTLTRNSVIKIAMGISDTLPTYLISWGIMSGVPIIASEEGCNPQVSENKQYRNMLINNIEILKKYGIDFKGAKELHECKENINFCEYEKVKKNFSKKRLITREDILKAKNNNQEILISENTIVTQLAKDAAKEIGVSINITN
ncbi:hypothetical protein GOQ29_02800 [Clostridium sp. D2Q-14]|uniref:flavoprotein n=1 Tax=Anaeromonas gelatinilytica TaxID=2683194 RepID=UPI00193B33AF|nr:flavoprotein [Anaeromonas gelatinilytica]MBS4534538.1 hypothetical protein [Anaeromonas gelatinilytica]